MIAVKIVGFFSLISLLILLILCIWDWNRHVRRKSKHRLIPLLISDGIYSSHVYC